VGTDSLCPFFVPELSERQKVLEIDIPIQLPPLLDHTPFNHSFLKASAISWFPILIRPR
jgi:hypothetical protein